MLALYSYMPRPFRHFLVGSPAICCAAPHWFICSHCTNIWSCSYTALLKRLQYRKKKKRVSTSVLTDAVQTVVSIGKLCILSENICIFLLKYWVPPINFAFSHKTFALSRKKYCVTPRNFAFSHKSAKIKIVLQVNNSFFGGVEKFCETMPKH